MKIKDFAAFKNDIELVAVIDHGGRAGNGFFLTLFDQHPEVIACAWMHYTYSYIQTLFVDNESIPTQKIRQLWTTDSYFKYVYQELDDEMRESLIRFGGDPGAAINRMRVRDVFNENLLGRDSLSRKELVLLTFYSYAIGAGKDLDKIKYVMVSDAISLRTENPKQGFSGKIIEKIVADFPDARLISLVRDPRAQFASNRHQFTNMQGNMYGITLRNCVPRLQQLIRNKLLMYEGCVFSYWFQYQMAAAKSIYRMKHRFQGHFATILNEQLNTDFLRTIQAVTDWLQIEIYSGWSDANYQPTMVGSHWKGTGAYNSRYQTYTNGPLKNDAQKVADKVTGPNRYVTERWLKKMSHNEIYIMEYLFFDELEDVGYQFYTNAKQKNLWVLFFRVWLPFIGEIPRIDWLIRGKQEGLTEISNRCFYYLALPLFYFISRLVLLRLVFTNFFAIKIHPDITYPKKDQNLCVE